MEDVGESRIVQADLDQRLSTPFTASFVDTDLMSAPWSTIYSAFSSVSAFGSSPGSKSSSAFSSSSSGIFQDETEDLSEPWKAADDDLGRILGYPDSGLDSVFSYDLFPEYSPLIPSDIYGTTSDNSSTPLPGFSTFRNLPFDESLIPTCVRDIWESDTKGFVDDRCEAGGQLMDSEEDNPSNTSFSSCDSQASSSPRALVISSSPSNDLEEKKRRRRRPGRPRKGGNEELDDDAPTTTHHSRKRRKQHPWKGHHLWEFIRELLENSDDPSRAGYGSGEELVRWENREKGVFLIVNSKEVAELWGKRKRNDKMTYEKLSRSLRWCRTSGFLAEVPKDRKYPKKLCFCFGHRAYDIHRSKTTDS